MPSQKGDRKFFSLLSQIFRIFYTAIAVDPDTCNDIGMVACCLHKLLRDVYSETAKKPFYNHNVETKTPTQNLMPLTKVGNTDYSPWLVNTGMQMVLLLEINLSGTYFVSQEGSFMARYYNKSNKIREEETDNSFTLLYCLINLCFIY